MKSAAMRHPARLAGASLLRLQSDARLAELAVAGHEAAFDAIVDRYRAPLLRYCAGIAGPSRAEDAVQQTLINAHEAMTRTDEVRHLKSWLYRIAHNASLNVLRAVRDDVPLDEATLGARATAGTGATAGPDESFERSEQFRETLAALQALPERQRAALVLRELEGRSHEEIAEALGVTKGSARQHLMRARVAVRSAVTAVTPYPLVARFAELLSGGSAPGWVDAAAGAGASATLMKLGAGVAATGALVGGAVGTQHVVRGGSHETATPPAAKRVAATPAVKRASAPRQEAGAVGAVVPVERASSPMPARTVPRKRKHPASPPPGPPVERNAPAATVPATSHRGRDDAEKHRNRGKGHGPEKAHTPSSAHGPAEHDGPGGNGGHEKSGNGKAKGNGGTKGNGGKSKSTSSDSPGKGHAKDDGQPSTPTIEDQPKSNSGSKGSDSKASKNADDASTAPTSATPATTTPGDED